MKTQAFKNSETYNQGGTFTLIALLIFSAAVYTVAFNIRAALEKNYTINNSNTGTLVNELPATSTAENIMAEQPVTSAASSTALYQEYLVPALEQTFNITDATLIRFPETTSVESYNDQFITELRALANAKIEEAMLVYELQASLKEFAEPEAEQPLALENWMTDEKCWCRRNGSEMAMANQPKNPAVKQ